jgi:hypothetical protein
MLLVERAMRSLAWRWAIAFVVGAAWSVIVTHAR